MNIFLIGFMGSGKTTLGKYLAAQLNFSFIDSDLYIEAEEKKTIPEIFQQYSESYFRKKEGEFIFHAQLLDRSIISTGAGLACSTDHILRLNQLGITVWLNVDENILVKRLEKDYALRPKLADFENIEEAVHALLGNRKKFYAQAKFQIKNPTEKTLLEMVKKII
jgi:shikimate kinase